MAINSKRKPKTKRTTIKTMANFFNRTLKPEREIPTYEFSNGTKTKKSGNGAYTK